MISINASKKMVMKNNAFSSLLKTSTNHSSEFIIKNQSRVVSMQIHKIIEEIKASTKSMESFDYQRKLLDNRIANLENIISNNVTQSEFREHSIRTDEKILSKCSKTIETVHSELSKHKDYIDSTMSEMREVVNKNEMKTINKIKDCEAMLRERVSESYLEVLLKSRDERINKSQNKMGDMLSLRVEQVYNV